MKFTLKLLLKKVPMGVACRWLSGAGWVCRIFRDEVGFAANFFGFWPRVKEFGRNGGKRSMVKSRPSIVFVTEVCILPALGKPSEVSIHRRNSEYFSIVVKRTIQGMTFFEFCYASLF